MFDETTNGGNGDEKRTLESKVEEKPLHEIRSWRSYCDAMILKESRITIKDGRFITNQDFIESMMKLKDYTRMYNTYHKGLNREKEGLTPIRSYYKTKKRAAWTFWEYHDITWNPIIEAVTGNLANGFYTTPQLIYQHNQNDIKHILESINQDGAASAGKKNCLYLPDLIEKYTKRKGRISKKDRKTLDTIIPLWEDFKSLGDLEWVGTCWTRLVTRLALYPIEKWPQYWERMEEFAREDISNIPETWQPGRINLIKAKKWANNYHRYKDKQKFKEVFQNV